MQRFWCGTYSHPVRGENADGCQSFAPGAAGQMSLASLFVPGAFEGSLMRRPVFKSTPFVLVMYAYGSADSTCPVARSRTYM